MSMIIRLKNKDFFRKNTFLGVKYTVYNDEFYLDVLFSTGKNQFVCSSNNFGKDKEARDAYGDELYAKLKKDCDDE